MAARVISKSKYLSGLQCEKLLWHHFRAKEAIPPPDAATQAVFDRGHSVGDLAKRLFPGGVEIPLDIGFRATIDRTQDLLDARVPLFEASFLTDGLYCRCDLLIPVGEDEWDLIEVKSGTSVKEVNLLDVAFQWHVLEGNGLSLRSVSVMYVNNEYERQGEIDPAGLLTSLDVTREARALREEVPARIESMRNAIAGLRPEIPIGQQCTDPYVCPLHAYCREFLPKNSVAELYRVGKKAYEFIGEGVLEAIAVPEERLSSSQWVQKAALQTGEIQVKREFLRAWLAELHYPLHFLDFEAVAPAVPLFDGTRPYQQIPFQFSLHIVREPGGEVQHHEFLADGREDPRGDLIDALGAIGQTGHVVAWFTGFEKAVLLDAVAFKPGERALLRGIAARLVDLLEPFRKFWVHHPEQHGSCSLKAVLPALTGISYSGLAVQDGNHAAREFTRILGGGLAEEEEAAVRASLLAYCKQDTEALVRILGVLMDLASN